MMHRLSPQFYMEAKFRSLYKIILKKDGYQSRLNFSEERPGTPFFTTKGMKSIHCSSKYSTNNAISILYFNVF